jgi:uncharacterized Zn-binding protein involved in type VI secretion
MPGLIAVQGCMVTGTPAVTPLPQPNPTFSTTVLVDGKGVFFDKITLPIAGLTIPAGTITAPATVDIPGVSQNVLVDGKPVVCLGDKVTVTVSWTQGSSSGSVPVTFTVTDAGQTSVQEF